MIRGLEYARLSNFRFGDSAGTRLGSGYTQHSTALLVVLSLKSGTEVGFGFTVSLLQFFLFKKM